MCAILGFIGRSRDERADTSLLWDMAEANTFRGPHAWGVAAIQGGRLKTHKQPGLITRRKLAVEERITRSRAFAIHMRYATKGSPKANENNHPHSFGPGVLVHNGTVTNHGDLASELGLYGYQPTTDCDSELLAICVQASAAKRRVDRVAEAVQAAVDHSIGSQVWHSAVAVWANQMVIVRAGKKLSWTTRREGIYFASLGVDASWNPVETNRLVSIRFGKDRNRVERLAL